MSCLVVFGREPVPGKVKTRLAASVGDAAAARLYQVLLEHTLRVAVHPAWQTLLSLSEVPSPGWADRFDLPIEVQPAGDLGERLAATFALRFAEGRTRVAVVGSDCPQLAVGHLEAAFRSLARHQVVLGPSADGGYWLVGQRAPGVDLFSSIPWSSRDTLDATRRRLCELGVPALETDRLEDVDTLADLRRLMAGGGLGQDLRHRLQEALGRSMEGG